MIKRQPISPLMNGQPSSKQQQTGKDSIRPVQLASKGKGKGKSISKPSN